MTGKQAATLLFGRYDCCHLGTYFPVPMFLILYVDNLMTIACQGSINDKLMIQ